MEFKKGTIFFRCNTYGEIGCVILDFKKKLIENNTILLYEYVEDFRNFDYGMRSTYSIYIDEFEMGIKSGKYKLYKKKFDDQGW